MRPVLLGHSFFFFQVLSFSLCFFHRFFTPPTLSLYPFFNPWMSFLFFLLHDGLKDAEQPCKKGGSALIKCSYFLSSPRCWGGCTAKIDEGLSVHKQPTTSVSQADCDEMPTEWPACITMSAVTAYPRHPPPPFFIMISLELFPPTFQL